MLQAEYIRDMHSNYLVLKGIEGSKSNYGVKMLLNNIIQGMLNVELRCIDKMDLFYYDITSKKTISSVYGNKSLNYDEIKYILGNILHTIDHIGEYLLSENDFIIDPEYIYINYTSQTIDLCHLVGYQVNIQEQLSRLIEYLMNKVDYKDEEAVLLTYAMYKESREVDCTFEKLLSELNKKFRNENKTNQIKTEKKDGLDNNIRDAKINEAKIKEPKINEAKINYCKINDYNIKDDKQKIDNIKCNTMRKNAIKKDTLRKDVLRKDTLKKDTLRKDTLKNDILRKDTPRNDAYKFKNTTINNFLSHNSKSTKTMDKYSKDSKIPSKNISNAINTKVSHSKEIINSPKSNKYNQVEHQILEEVENEQEILYFEQKTYITAGISILAGIIVIIVAVQLKVLHNAFGTHLDIVKVICCMLMVICVEVFIIIKLFDKNNRITRIECSTEYIEQSQESIENPISNTKVDQIANPIANSIANQIEKSKEKSLEKPIDKNCYDYNRIRYDENSQEDETQLLWSEDCIDQDKTMILAKIVPQKSYYLESCNFTENVKTQVKNYPFIIGKLGKGVNLKLEDTSVSRLHAKLTREEDAIYLTDLGSTNGTYINKTRLVQKIPYPLSVNDEISFSQLVYYWKEN